MIGLSGHIHQNRVSNIQLLQSLGSTMNWKKSMLDPSRTLDFLGLHFKLEGTLISPPDSFLDYLTSVLSHLSTSTDMPARNISSITSRISHFAPFIHHGRLHLRFLQFWIKRHWAQHRQSWDTEIQLDAEFLNSLGSADRKSPGSASASSGTHPILLHRCITNRMGSQLAESSPLRTVVSSGFLSAHQLAGARGHPTSCT